MPSPHSDSPPIHLRVVGIPEPMGSKRGFVHNGRARIVDARSVALRSWQSAIATAARDYQSIHPQPLLDEPVVLRAEFYLPRPKSVPAWRIWPAGKPDADKLARSLDPLSGIIYRDDAQIVRLKVTKAYADDRPPGVDITITPLGRQLSPRARLKLEREGV